MLKTLKYFCLVFIITVMVTSCGVKKSIQDRPDLSEYTILEEELIVVNDSLSYNAENSLRQNKYGQWELVAKGNPYELGNSIGLLSDKLIKKQEKVFFSKVEDIVPSKFKQWLLRKFLGFYNRKLYKHVKEEYKAEIYGISKFTNDQYDYIADKYVRSLYLHGAHDIGHAMQDLAIVGCSSFAVWGEKSTDGKLLVARNFDFYAGDEFSENKIIYFIQPEHGYKYASISWAGMIGVMSGMNEKGLTVTINAGKSNIPWSAKTPISLVTREILQYASNIDEAIAIAKNKEVFVSESILVGSASDNRAVSIEIAPHHFGIFEVENSSELICSNHFQSNEYKYDKKNITHIEESHSKYRMDRMMELLEENKKINPIKAVEILRNREGIDDKKIGYGNEKALNQLLAHHGVVFQPHKKTFWVSANPYQLGEFVSFHLDSVFKNSKRPLSSLSLPRQLIAEDPFIATEEYKNYEKYRVLEREIETKIEHQQFISNIELNKYIGLNPEYWRVYYFTGKYYYTQKQYKKASVLFRQALTKEITTLPDKEIIEKYIKKCKKKY